MKWKAKGGDGAEQYGGTNPVGNIGPNENDELRRRARNAPPISEARRAELLKHDQQNYDNRHQN